MEQRFLAILALGVLALGPMGAAWAQVKVPAADPAINYQGTASLDVIVSGSGDPATGAKTPLLSGFGPDGR